jgi:hypothetical protein
MERVTLRGERVYVVKMSWNWPPYPVYLGRWKFFSHLWVQDEQHSTRVENLNPAMGRGINSKNWVWNWVGKLHCWTGRHDNPMPTWFLAHIAGVKLPTLASAFWNQMVKKGSGRTLHWLQQSLVPMWSLPRKQWCWQVGSDIDTRVLRENYVKPVRDNM